MRWFEIPYLASRRKLLRSISMAGLVAASLVVTGLSISSIALADGGKGKQHWVGTWAASPQTPNPGGFEFENQTLRQIVHTSIGGDQVRVRFSNAFGDSSLVIGAARIAVHGGAASIVADTDRELTFNGSPSIIIPAGAVALSDPVDLEVLELEDLAVSMYLPESTGLATLHSLGLQTNYISVPGDHTAIIDMPFVETAQSWFFLSGVEVMASKKTGAVVTIGDSITDGFASTPDANNRYPNFLAERLLSGKRKHRMAVLNAGISGNRVLHDFIGPSASSRFDRDVLAQSGVTHVIVLESINDIGIPGAFGLFDEEVSAERIILGLQQLIARAHAHGLTIFGGTLTPFEGTIFPGYFTPEGEEKRQAVNAWIRNSGAFDAVIDFDEAIRDPSHPSRMLPAYDIGDHLHPNDAGYEAMADAIDLKLFE